MSYIYSFCPSVSQIAHAHLNGTCKVQLKTCNLLVEMQQEASTGKPWRVNSTAPKEIYTFSESVAMFILIKWPDYFHGRKQYKDKT